MKNSEFNENLQTNRKRRNLLKRWVLKLTSFLRKKHEEIKPEQVEEFLEENQEIINNMIEFNASIVSDIMVPRSDIVAIASDVSIDKLADILISKRHTRMPVYRDNIDNIVGFIHIKDILPFIADRRLKFKMGLILRQVLVVPPSMPISHLLTKMRNSLVNIAIVVDEYGGTDGMVTIEDLIEQIVGEIEDEHDIVRTDNIITLEDNMWIVNARAEIEEVENFLKINLKENIEKLEECNTINGLVMSLFEKIPKIGEKIIHPNGFEFEVLDADPRTIKRVQLRKTAILN